ncbi:cupin domain-containing protein [Amycolatopsis sp. cg5]|uniref:cupin domain-containing protein n=1 Tax=Amycolatopsis sp. cg5 TaxID=3238802 RepID=UPI00352595EA
MTGNGFSLNTFLKGLTDHVPPGQARPLVLNADELEQLPASAIHNPSELAIAGRLPTFGFEIFHQVIPAGLSSDMQRHHHETVHYVISGRGHSEVEDERVEWTTGACVYTPPWTWHRHYNDDENAPVVFLTIEGSRLVAALGLTRRQSAGLVTIAEARAAFGD